MFFFFRGLVSFLLRLRFFFSGHDFASRDFFATLIFVAAVEGEARLLERLGRVSRTKDAEQGEDSDDASRSQDGAGSYQRVPLAHG